MHRIWADLLHWTGSDNVSGVEYGFWSGFGGDLTLFAAVIAWPWIQLKKANCQVKRCWRLGRHDFPDPVDHVTRRLCWKHHPDVGRRQITRQRLHLYLGERPGRG